MYIYYDGFALLDSRPSLLIVDCDCRYTMIKHQHEETNKANPERFNMLKKADQFQKTDGLNNLK